MKSIGTLARMFSLLVPVAFCLAAEVLAARASADGLSDSMQIEEIVVTARKRAESLQEVPVSAAVVSGTTIADQNIASIMDLSTTLPDVTFAKGTTTNRQFIRGIGSGDNPSFEQSVGTFIDDIYHGRARSSEANFFDLERVEVLKGPQTTYFGNNAIAGALNIITRDPGTVVAGDARLAYTPKFDGYTAEAGIDLPLSPVMGVRLAGYATGGDGWIDDIGADQHVPRTRDSAMRGTFLWKPTDQFTARFKAQYTDEHEQGGLPVVREDCPQPAPFPSPAGLCAAAIGANAAPYSSDFTRNTIPGQSTRLATQDYVATLSQDQDAFILSSVTGYTQYNYHLGSDLDLTPLALLLAEAPERYQQFSQELRITSNDRGPIEYIGGAYYQHGLLRNQTAFGFGILDPVIQHTPPFAPLIPYLPLTVNDQFRELDNTESAFGALTWKITGQLRATGALRYATVHKDFDQDIGMASMSPNFGPVVPLPPPVAPIGAALAGGAGLATVGTTALSRTDSHLSPSVSLQYDATSNVMLYVRYDNGFKAGGFNGADFAGAEPFAPEKVNAFEVGAKTKVFDNRVTLDIAAFDSTYHDLQLAGIVPSASGAYVNRVQNAGGAISRGIELEAGARITAQLRTSLSGTYLKSFYSSYPNATATALQTLQGVQFQNLSGQETPFAPKFSASWNVNYTAEINSSLSWRIENRLFATKHYLLNFNNDPYVVQRDYAREDLTLSLMAKQGWEVDIIGQNLTNRTIYTYGAAIPATLGSFDFMTEPPRSVTLQAKYSF